MKLLQWKQDVSTPTTRVGFLSPLACDEQTDGTGILAIKNRQGGREHWAVYYTLVPKVFLFVGLTTLGTFIEF